MTTITYEEMYEVCNRNREEDGFCRVCCACSGPCQSNLARDYNEQLPENVTIYRGGGNSCKFYVQD